MIQRNKKNPDKYCIFCINTIKSPEKSLEQLNQLIIIIEEYMIALRYPKTCYFDFEYHRDVERT